ncbi:MAG: hemolysin family protein [Flavobacteriaceae bacterium]
MEIQLAIIFLSIVFSAFFSGMEIAFVSSNRLQIEIEKNKGGFLSKILKKLTKNPSKFITTMLIGNNIALVIYGYYMGDLLIGFIAPYLSNTFLILITQTFISTVIILVTAEFLPKAIFRIFANEALIIFALPAYFFYLLFYVISIFISYISDLILKLFFNTTNEKGVQEFSKKELDHFITEQLVTSNDDVDSEIHIFQNALNFHNVKAREVMVPRTEIIAVEVNETIENLRNLFVETSLTKIIVYKKTLDNIIGYVKAFELFKNPKSIKSILLLTEAVPESMTIKNILETLSKKKKNVAIVLDEYGGTSGLITKEDIIEELFGEIEDEHDNIELTEQKISESDYILSTRLEIDYLNKTYDFNLPKEEAFETLGGYIVNRIERIPEVDEKITIDNYQITINKVDANRIDEIYLKIINLES